MYKTKRNLILTAISLCSFYITILFTDSIKILSLCSFIPIAFYLLIYSISSLNKKIKLSNDYQAIAFFSLILFSTINIIKPGITPDVIKKEYFLVLIIIISSLNIYFSNTGKEIKANVFGLMFILITILVSLYSRLTSQFQTLIVAYFFFQFALLFLLRMISNTERLCRRLIKRNVFVDQKMLFDFVTGIIISEKVKIKLIEKITDAEYLKSIIIDSTLSNALRIRALECIPLNKIMHLLSSSIPPELIFSAIDQMDLSRLFFVVDHFPQQYGIAATKRLYLLNNIGYTNNVTKYLFDDILNEFIADDNPIGVIGICRRAIDFLGLKEVSLLSDVFRTDNLVKWYKKQEPFNFEIQYTLCTCFEVFPSFLLIEKLSENWVEYENEFRKKLVELNSDENHSFEIASGALLRALGACSSKDVKYVNLQRDTTLINEIKELENKCTAIRAQMEPLKARQTAIINSLHNPVDAKEDKEFINLNNKIKELSYKYQQYELEIYRKHTALSSANIIKRVIADVQRYSYYVRQNAEIGLNTLIKDSYLNEEIKNELMVIIKTSKESQKDDDQYFTHEVRLFENSKAGEILYILKIAYNKVSSGSVISPNVLKRIIDKIFEKQPDAIRFLEKYPLKLMRDDIKNRLGWYLEKGYHLTYWTYYTPPKGIGEVRRRYLTLNNLSLPNGMGLDYRLFQDELLVLPVLYHEYLHYTGIKNESEVWLRQNIFLWSLILELSENYSDLIEFHQRILDSFTGIQDNTSITLLDRNAQSDDYLNYLNDTIRQNYGKTLELAEAEELVSVQIKKESDAIRTLNNDLEWHREVEYPILDAPEVINIKNLIKSITIQNKTQNNFMTKERFNEILNEEVVRIILAKWSDFQLRLKEEYTKNNLDYDLIMEQYKFNLPDLTNIDLDDLFKLLKDYKTFS